MKILKETFFERLRNRLAPHHAVKTITQLQRLSFEHDRCYGAVKEASEYLEHYRREAMASIRAFRSWEAGEAVCAALAPSRESFGRLLAQQARDAATLYLDARRDYHDLVHLSIARTRERGPTRPAND